VNGGKPGPARLLARCLLGLAGGAAVFLGLKALFPGPASDWHTLGRFVRYGAAGLWASAGAPWLFLALRLAARWAGPQGGCLPVTRGASNLPCAPGNTRGAGSREKAGILGDAWGTRSVAP